MKTVIFHHDLYIKMWDWLAKNPDCDKHEWPEWGKVIEKYGKISNLCFACHADTEFCDITNEPLCSNCPFGNYTDFHCMDRLFTYWRQSTGRQRTYYAEKIRDYPLSNGWEPI